MKVLCVDGDFTDFIKENGNGYALPKEGVVYTVRGRSESGGLLLNELSNPFSLVSLSPLLFMELHFNEKRFVYLTDEDTGRAHPSGFTYLISKN